MPHLSTGKSVLCVDDDVRLLKLISSYLGAYGYKVVAEASGREALRQAAKRSFYAAVLDFCMPDLNGGELAAEISRLHPKTAIILFTGSRSAVPVRVASIADVILSKQDGVEALVAALENIGEFRRQKPVRRFPRYPVQVPILVKVARSGHTASLHGTTVTLAEGGLGVHLDGDIAPGEAVVIEFADPQLLGVRPQAQVRYRAGNVYGFEFISLEAHQAEILRHSCQQRAS